jgi:hypothetical protein
LILRDRAQSADGLLFGVEHEFRVLSDTGGVDFRRVIHDLALGQPNLDPADPNAYRLPSGAAVTCDGGEAEIALPPVQIGPGFALEVAHRAEVERAALLALMPEGMRLEGCSTHLSVSLPDALTKRACQLYATTFAPALMLLMDRRESPGLLVRPRPGRVELGGEYIDGEPLVAAALFAVGSVLAFADAVAADDERRALPPQLSVRVEPALERFGWYVDRTAFGGDLYADGRSAALRTTDGQELSAQAHLEGCWEIAREAVEGLAMPEELAVAGDIVAGVRPLPTERAIDDPAAPPLSRAPLPPSPYGSALGARERPSFEIAPVMVTWDLAVFLVLDRGRARRAFAAVPGAHLGRFLRELDLGRLDQAITGFLSGRPTGRRLESRSQALVPGLFDDLGPRLALLRPEFGPDGVQVAAMVSQRRGTARRRWRAWWRRFTAERRWAGGTS